MMHQVFLAQRQHSIATIDPAMLLRHLPTKGIWWDASTEANLSNQRKDSIILRVQPTAKLPRLINRALISNSHPWAAISEQLSLRQGTRFYRFYPGSATHS
jgi:hypothetical protein